MKVGDRVVCVKAHSDPECPLKVKSIYTIFNARKCKCGEVGFDVGIMLPPGYSLIECNKCGMVERTHIWTIRSRYFAPIQFNSATEELANKEIVEERSDAPIKEPVNT